MDFNQFKAVSVQYLKKGKDMAVDAAQKGKVEALVLNQKAKLYHAQRQLGALVYSLAKGHEENQPLVDKYVAVIAQIEQEIESLKASLTPEEQQVVVAAEYVADQEVVASEQDIVVDADVPAEAAVVEEAAPAAEAVEEAAPEAAEENTTPDPEKAAE